MLAREVPVFYSVQLLAPAPKNEIETPMTEPMNDRLTELEIKLSLTEDLVDELDRTVFRQQEQLDLLQAQLQLLYKQMQSATGPAEPRNLRDEIPPHY
jgi:SlyX protein